MFYFSKFSFLIFLFSLFAGFYFSSYAVSNIQVCGVRQIHTVFDYTNNDYLSSDNCNSLRMLYAVGDTNTKATITNSSTGIINMAGLTTANSVGIYGGANSNIINQGKITNVTSSANNSNVSGMYLVGANSTALNDTTGEIICNTEFSTFGILGSGGTITNNGNITGCSRGLYIRDIGATAVNNGTITCLNGTGIGMYAINGATATNKGVIKDCATGMVSNGIGSNAINESYIACYNTTGKGMQSLNGGTITNNGSITGCAGSVNSGNIDNGSINDGTIGSPVIPIIGVYVCGIDTGLLSYTNKAGNTLECLDPNNNFFERSVIYASNSNTTAVNNGIINNSSNYYTMYASNGGSVINNNVINFNRVGSALSADGINSKAINSESGKIICIGNMAMYGTSNAIIENNGLISCNSYGMLADNSTAINGKTGTIENCGVGKVGIYAKNGGEIYNYGFINCVGNSSGFANPVAGMLVEGKGFNSGYISISGAYSFGMSANNNNSLIINNSIGTIDCTSGGWDGMATGHQLSISSTEKGDNIEVVNNGLIKNCNKGFISVSLGKNNLLTNNGVIECLEGVGVGIYIVSNEGHINDKTAVNNGYITNCKTGISITGSQSIANNQLTGVIICSIVDEYAYTTGIHTRLGILNNDGLIKNCDNGIIAEGVYNAVFATATNTSTGRITCENGKKFSTGMSSTRGATVTNQGLIENCDYAMGNNGSIAINGKTGVIKCFDISGGGMQTNGGIATNEGLIKNCGTGINVIGENEISLATNTTTGKIMCNSGLGIGMEALNNGIVTNEGLIENCAIGMQSDGAYGVKSTAINASTGVIKCYDSTGIGMQSINGGIIKNEGTIIGCSDSVSVASSDEPSISLAIALEDSTEYPSTPSTGSTPRGALSYDIASGVTASYINSGLTNQSMGGSFVEVTGSGTLAIKNSGTILCGSGLEECFGMNGTHNTTYEASVGAGNTMGSVIVLDDSTINIPQTSIIGGAIPDKEYTYKDVFVSSGGGSITGADNITSGSIVWNVTPVANDHSVDVIVTKNSYTDLASAEHSAIASVLEANYNGSNLYQSLNQKDIKSFNSALNQLSGADLSGGRGANLDSMSLINKADSGFNSRQDFISSYEGSYDKESSFASNVGDITMGETQNQLTENVTVRSVMAISQVSNNPLYNTYSYRYAGRVGLGKNYGFYTNTQLLQASSYNARTMDLGSGVSTLGRIENVTAIISDNYAYVSAKASDNVTLLAYSGASTSYSMFSDSTEQASNTDMQFASLNLGSYNQTVVSAVLGQEIAYKSKTNGTLSLMAKVSTPLMSVGNERTASFSTGESFIVNTEAEIGVYTATLGMNYVLGDSFTRGWNAKVSAYREINSIEINDNAYATIGYAF